MELTSFYEKSSHVTCGDVYTQTECIHMLSRTENVFKKSKKASINFNTHNTLEY